MSPEAQRIAIAEACGWEFAPGYPQQLAKNEAAGKPWQYLNGDGTNKGIPDYLNDLNAMHEAEKILEDKHEKGRLMATYAQWKLPSVCQVYTKAIESNAGSTTDYWLIHATAAQRAEAFLRTLGLWDYTK